jgi:hypothetical protein
MGILSGRKEDLSSILRRKTFAAFDGGERGRQLSGLCLELLADQKKTWPDLRRGCESLREIREREFPCRGYSVRLQHNPARLVNTLADTGQNSAEERHCFLCLENLPESQKGILYRNEYLILANPRPIFPGHFTVAHLKHRPQAIEEEIPNYLRLLAEFGPGWTVFYNGPRCGASAPDHLHFQAAPAGQMPIEREVREEKRLADLKEFGGVRFFCPEDLGRAAVVMEGDDPLAMERLFRSLLAGLKNVLRPNEEPMINAAGFHEGGKWRLLIFPRRKHRPEAFFRKGEDRIVVSPGLIDMGGVLITPQKKDFERLDAATVEGIYEEVSLEPAVLKEAMTRLSGLD